MKRFLALLLILLPEGLYAAPNITVSGNSVTILGSAQTISLTCTLIDPNNTGNLRSGSNIITVFVTSTVTPGNVATCGPIYGNDVILDGFGNSNSTYYKVQVFTVTGGIVASTASLQQFYAFTGSGTVDLSTATPLAPSFMTGINGSVVVPGTFSVKTFQNVRMADQFAGADCGAKINAADTDLGATAGEIWVNQNCGLSWTTAISISANHFVKIIQPPGTQYSSSATITFSGNSSGMLCSMKGDNNSPGCLIQETAGSNLATLVQVNGYNVTLQYLAFDCNKANNSTGLDCITVSNAKFQFYNSNAYNAKRNNLVLGGATEDSRLTNCALFTGGNNGLEIQSGATDIFWTNCESINNGNISIHSTGTIGGVHFIGGEISNLANSTGDCMFLDGTAGAVNTPQVVGMDMNPCAQNGIHMINANGYVISGVYINNPGQLTNNTYDGIQMSGGGDGVISGVTIVDGGTACSGHSCMRYGINLLSATQASNIQAHVRGGQTGAFNDATGLLNTINTTGQVQSSQQGQTLVLNGGTTNITVQNKTLATTNTFLTSVTGDSNSRFGIEANGQLDWGSGSAGADTHLSRTGSDQLTFNGFLVLGSGSVSFTSTLLSGTAPTIAAAGCGGAAASISAQNGTGAFNIGVGTTPGSACTITMPAAATSWNCDATTVSATTTTNYMVKQTGALSTTSVVLTLFSDAAVATAFQGSDTLRVKCSAD